MGSSFLACFRRPYLVGVSFQVVGPCSGSHFCGQHPNSTHQCTLQRSVPCLAPAQSTHAYTHAYSLNTTSLNLYLEGRRVAQTIRKRLYLLELTHTGSVCETVVECMGRKATVSNSTATIRVHSGRRLLNCSKQWLEQPLSHKLMMVESSHI